MKKSCSRTLIIHLKAPCIKNKYKKYTIYKKKIINLRFTFKNDLYSYTILQRRRKIQLKFYTNLFNNKYKKSRLLFAENQLLASWNQQHRFLSFAFSQQPTVWLKW